MAAELEAELAEQLAEQQEALGDVRRLLEADPGDAETAGLLAELEAGMRATKEALLSLTRQRLLAQLASMPGGEDGDRRASAAAIDGNQQGSANDDQAARPAPGVVVVFRNTDGRHYFGRVLEGGAAQGVLLQMVHPTRAHQLEPVLLPGAALHPAPAAPLHPAAADLQPGSRVVVQPHGSQLWAAAEVVEVDASGQRLMAVTLADKRRHIVPLTRATLSAHAPSPHGDDCSGQRAASDAGSSSSGEEGEGSSGEGSSGDSGEEDGGEGAAWDGAAFGRVGFALDEAANMLQQQAQAGAQIQTRLFFGSEAHSRGIGSKLLAKMGFRGGGHGLGRLQQGMQQALQAMALKKGAGLGVDGGRGVREGSKKRKRSGKQRRRDKAVAARQEQPQAAQQGMFDVLNSFIGDGSAAQAVRNASADGAAPGARAGRQAAAAGKAAPKEEDRRQLSQRADELAQLRHKVQRLGEMAARNAKDRLMLPQIRRALGEARAALAAAEQQHSASSRAIHDREKLKRMAKF